MGMRACVSGVKLHLYSFTANHSIPAPLRTVNQAKNPEICWCGNSISLFIVFNFLHFAKFRNFAGPRLGISLIEFHLAYLG